jgi:polyferredoxin
MSTVKRNTFVKIMANKRFYIQLVLGIIVFIAVSYYKVSLWWLLGIGTITGIIWGKVFCRWACPIGNMMEFIIKLSPDSSLQNMYMYHKIGCPIACTSGLLNKFSWYKIKLNKETCLSCGKCDKVCYMPSLNKEKFSLYKPNKTNPSVNFSCSKCLSCIENCPNGSLSFKPVFSITGNKDGL